MHGTFFLFKSALVKEPIHKGIYSVAKRDAIP